MGFEEGGQSAKQIDGQIRVVPEPYTLKIGQGQVDGHEPIRVYGTNDAVGTAMETVSETQGLLSYLAAAEKLKVSSNSTLDDTGGTGAVTVDLVGLASDYTVLTDTITMNGTVSVETNETFLRVFRATVATAGSTGANVGIIEVKDNADSVELLQMQSVEGATSTCTYTVPAGKVAVLTKFRGSAIGTQKAVVHLACRPFGGAWNVRHEIALEDTAQEVTFDTGVICTAKSDIEVRATGAATAPFVAGSFEGWYEDA